MIDFVIPLTPLVRSELLQLVKGIFWLYVPVSFICVAVYVAKAIRDGTLFEDENAPKRFAISGMTGWHRSSAGEQFGFERLRPVQVMSWSLLVFGAVMLVEMPLMIFAEWLFDALNLSHPDQENVEIFRRSNQPAVILGLMFQAVLFFPVIEELFFRGFLLTFLKNYMSTWLALFLSASLFAFAHLNLGAALPLWFLGLALGLAYEHSGSLLLPMGVHACWNLTTALSLLLDRGSS
jgi:membrane protease YdiL (CAAX protease family)